MQKIKKSVIPGLIILKNANHILNNYKDFVKIILRECYIQVFLYILYISTNKNNLHFSRHIYKYFLEIYLQTIHIVHIFKRNRMHKKLCSQSHQVSNTGERNLRFLFFQPESCSHLHHCQHKDLFDLLISPYQYVGMA